MRIKITVEATIIKGISTDQLSERVRRQLLDITNKDRCDAGITQLHSIQIEETAGPSGMAEWCRGKPCKLDNENAKITGWGGRFAKVVSLESCKSAEFSWFAVNGVMRRNQHFES